MKENKALALPEWFAIEKLDRLRAEGQDPREVLEQSILSCWSGLCAVKKDGATDGGFPI